MLGKANGHADFILHGARELAAQLLKGRITILWATATRKKKNLSCGALVRKRTAQNFSGAPHFSLFTNGRA
jgi:hypothetical protein